VSLPLVNWVQLPDGESVVIAKGFFYAVVAEVDDSHGKDFILKTAADNGLQVFDYIDPATLKGMVPESGYRFVALQGLATRDAGTVPWKAPWPLSVANSSHLVHVWTVPQGKNMPARPPAAPAQFPWVGVLTVTGFAAAVGGGWWWWRRRRLQHRQLAR
jgi:hypothetical protein